MRIALVIIALALPLAPAVAQRVPERTQSTRLRVTTTTSAGSRIGIYQALTDTTLVLAAGVTPFVVPLSEISRLERSRGRKLSVAGGLSGFIVGGVTGGLLGCAINRDSYGVFCGGQSDTKVFLGAALGSIAGAALGAVLLRRERWSTIDVNDLRSAEVPLPMPRAVRLAGNPLVTPKLHPSLGDNINGPSLLRVPDWVDRPLGRYYLYFAHHAGKFIRLAYADRIEGPWRVHEPGTLRLEQSPSCYDHVASPDVHVDSARREILMYVHCPAGATGGVDIAQQKTFLATSRDGVNFVAGHQPLGPAYFRVFRWGDYYYSVVRGGLLLRSKDPRKPFEEGSTLIPADSGRILRHAAVELSGNVLRVYYSRIGDRPERIFVSKVQLKPDWTTWRATSPVTVVTPERDYEGSEFSLEVSRPDEAMGVRQLRDPAIFGERGRLYLLYSIAGESGIAAAELLERPK